MDFLSRTSLCIVDSFSRITIDFFLPGLVIYPYELDARACKSLGYTSIKVTPTSNSPPLLYPAYISRLINSAENKEGSFTL